MSTIFIFPSLLLKSCDYFVDLVLLKLTRDKKLKKLCFHVTIQLS